MTVKRTVKAVRIISLLLCVILTAMFVSSCSLGNALLSAMGFDTYDYESEEVIETVDNSSEEVEKLCELVKILSVNDPVLPEFDSSSEAVSNCRDAILNYMLCTGFAMYTGNNDLISQVEDAYPGIRIITVIPSSDFENCVYTYFGGNTKVSHKSSELFTYLEKADVYTSIIMPIESQLVVEPILCEKTERTYRFKFRCSHGDKTSPVYSAIIINREDGSQYFKRLTAETEDLNGSPFSESRYLILKKFSACFFQERKAEAFRERRSQALRLYRR